MRVPNAVLARMLNVLCDLHFVIPWRIKSGVPGLILKPEYICVRNLVHMGSVMLLYAELFDLEDFENQAQNAMRLAPN